MRLVLYVTDKAVAALDAEKGRRARLAGVELSREATARAVLYGALGVEGGVSTPKEISKRTIEIQKEMIDTAREARRGELDVEYLYREIERWADAIVEV